MNVQRAVYFRRWEHESPSLAQSTGSSSADRISVINSPEELFFQHQGGSYSGGGGGGYFSMSSFTSDRMKFIWNLCKTKLFTSKNGLEIWHTSSQWSFLQYFVKRCLISYSAQELFTVFVPKNGPKLTCGRVFQHNFISKANLKNPEQGFLVHRLYLLRKQRECLWCKASF